ncbi:hypothetical protein AgCh_028239 [Apium graveolens]
MASHQLPAKVVRMLKDNGIKKVKLFDANDTTMNALTGSDIEVMVAIPNDQLVAMNTYNRAKQWVQRNVTRYIYNGGVNIKRKGLFEKKRVEITVEVIIALEVLFPCYCMTRNVLYG